MKPPILNIADVELQARPPEYAATGPTAARYDARMGQISRPLGAQKLGYNLSVLPPGMRAFPFHNHRVNEEMFYIIEGNGEVRIGAMSYPVRAGDIVACPPGDRDTAHQFVNTGISDLKVLAVSTMLSPDIAEYPDTGKFAVWADYPAGADGQPQHFQFVGRENTQVDYWQDE